MSKLKEITEYDKYNVLNEEESQKLRIICRIFAVLCNIPCLISIFIFIFQKSKLNLGQKIQFIICILISLYEGSHYIPVSSEHQWLCYFQCIISFGNQIIISYLIMIYSYIALIIFINPNSIKSKFNIFFIYFSTPILFISILFYLLFVPDLKIFFGLTVYPDDENVITRLMNYFLVFIFLLINIVNNIILIYKIKNFIKKLNNVDYFAKEKLRVFKRKLIFNIIGLVIIHNTLPVGILTSFKIISGDVFFHFSYFLYLYINQAILGLVYWFIYIFNKNLWMKFLILIKIEKTESFEEEFNKEAKILEYSEDQSITADHTININMEELENIPSVNNNTYMTQTYDDDEIL